MPTFADLLASTKQELIDRYRSPIWGPALVALAAFHWKIIIYLAIEKHSATEAITFIQNNASAISITSAFASAAIYVITFPWIEFNVERLAGHGKRKRNDFQIREKEYEVRRRKFIAEEQEKADEIERRNNKTYFPKMDREKVANYQKLISSEPLKRWLTALKQGHPDSEFRNAITSYLNKADAPENSFFDKTIDEAHSNFVQKLSTLQSAFNNLSRDNEKEKLRQISEMADDVQAQYLKYRKTARDILEI